MITRIPANPEVLSLWDYDSNVEDPTKIALGSDKMYKWKCPKHDFPYEASPQSMSRGRRCNVCSGKKVVAGYNDLGSSDRAFLSEWDYTRNPHTPEEVSCTSNKAVWWECSKGHYWQESPYFRIRRSDSCPFCTNSRVWVGFNDLRTTHPELAVEWADDLNDRASTDITKGSEYKAWWRCSEGHEWKAYAYSRTGSSQSGCPACWAATTTSRIEIELAEALGAELSYQLPIKWDRGRRYVVDIMMPDGVTIIEYDGWWWHKDITDRDIVKSANILGAGYKLIRVRENDLHWLPPQKGLHQISFYPQRDSIHELADAIQRI